MSRAATYLRVPNPLGPIHDRKQVSFVSNWAERRALRARLRHEFRAGTLSARCALLGRWHRAMLLAPA